MSTQLVVTVLYFASSLASLVFVARYAFRRWWTTTAGRLVMGLHLIMVGFGISNLLVLLHGLNYAGRILVSIGLLAALNVVMWGFSWELHKAQETGRKPQPLTEDATA